MKRLTAELRDRTRDLHAALDAALPLMSPTLTRDEYAQTIARMHAWWSPTERRAHEILRAGAFDVPLRERTPALAADLDAIGNPPPEGADTMALPALDSLERAIGCLYVLEGSALGGQFISRHVAQALGLTGASGCSFFSGDPADVGRRWREVCGAIDRCPPTTFDDAADGARRTFSSLLTWLT